MTPRLHAVPVVLLAVMALVLLGARPAPADAASRANRAEVRSMKAAVMRFVPPSQRAGLVVRRGNVSTRDRRFAAARIVFSRLGPQVAYLRRHRRGWRVLDIGPSRVGCGILPDAALVDLGGRCPDTV